MKFFLFTVLFACGAHAAEVHVASSGEATKPFATVERAGDGVIFENERYRFFPDRMESFDCYPGVFRSTDHQSITKDGDPNYTWHPQRSDTLTLRTPYPILDAVFALAVDETLAMIAPAGTDSHRLKGGQPGDQYYAPYYYWTHGSDIREYTRDSAQHIQWGDSVLLSPATARGTLLRCCDLNRRSIREDAVVTADSVHLIPAMWEYYRITGDRSMLETCWGCLWNTMQEKQRTQLQNDGLWNGSMWSDAQAGFLKPEHFQNRHTSVKSLYANTVAAGAWRDLEAIATTRGKSAEAKVCSDAYAALKNAINRHLYRPEFGTYCYYKYEPTGQYCDYREDIAAGMIYLFGVADASRTLEYHAKFKPTPYGYRNVDPVLPSGEAAYHGGNPWEDQEAYHGWAMALLRKPDELRPFIFWHARNALPLKQWREGTINPSTGLLHHNYKRLIWGSLGYVCYWTRGVFGFTYETDGLRFVPCVPQEFGGAFRAMLRCVDYRRSRLRIALSGCGTNLQEMRLDGKAATIIPTTLTGEHEVEIRLAPSKR